MLSVSQSVCDTLVTPNQISTFFINIYRHKSPILYKDADKDEDEDEDKDKDKDEDEDEDGDI